MFEAIPRNTQSLAQERRMWRKTRNCYKPTNSSVVAGDSSVSSSNAATSVSQQAVYPASLIGFVGLISGDASSNPRGSCEGGMGAGQVSGSRTLMDEREERREKTEGDGKDSREGL